MTERSTAAAGVPPPTTPVRLPTSEDPYLAALLGRCCFPPAGTPVSCAVSGGADSTALAALAVAAGLDVTMVHVDHGLRPGSGDEAHLVASLASSWGARFRALTAVVDHGGDLEARARDARHGVLPPDTLFGHTADDQAETVLLRLLRGTGPAGLAAMRPDRHPLLELRRVETRALCDHLGVAVFVDPTNDDPRFGRNRVRNEVLPLLDDVAARDVVPLLCRLAELSAEQADLIAGLAAALDPTDAHALRAAEPPVAAQAVRHWWAAVTGSAHPPDAKAVGRILDVAAGTSVACDVADGWRVRRSGGRLFLEHP